MTWLNFIVPNTSRYHQRSSSTLPARCVARYNRASRLRGRAHLQETVGENGRLARARARPIRVT